ncbi:Uncharacterised protein [Mycobacteroides abscessus subsp. abscessus]|nr:Uncharacterised protein [Mycobacteroides abscessus subsp. abscessus]
MALTRRPAAVALPPAERFPCSSSAATVTSMRGTPVTITRWAPAPPSGGLGQSGAQSGWMRVTCSITRRGSPSTMPCTSNRTAPWVPAANSPISSVRTVCSRGRRSSVSRRSSSSTPSARASSRTCPPHTMVGTPAASMGGA